MKKWIFAGMVILLAAAVYYFYPRTVDLQEQGIKYRLGAAAPSYEQPIQVHVKGKLYRRITGNRTFIGTIELEGEEMPVPPNQRKVELRFNKDNAVLLVYPYVHNAKPYIHAVGRIYFDKTFSKFTLTVLDKEHGWSGDNGLMITAPAANRTEALAISNALMEHSLDGYVLK